MRERDLPPLPKKRRGFLCTKCGNQACLAGQEDLEHPTCSRCDYLGFAQDIDYSDDEMRAYALDACFAGSSPARDVEAPAAINQGSDGGLIEGEGV